MKKLGLAGCRDNTADVYKSLIDAGFAVEALLTISPESAEKSYHISGYVDMANVINASKTELVHVEDYSLRKSAEDKSRLLGLDLDLLIVIGWQRIIPKWYLDALSIGAIGMHGASKPLPFGRGHSALNWSLIEQRTEFFDSLFFYTPKADDGDIIGTHRFDISSRDTCQTLHYKHRLSMKRLLIRELPGILNGTTVTKRQPTEGATYYPKRSPKDGKINWNFRASEIDALVRAVTEPYPGASTNLGDDVLEIWAGQPFDTMITWNAKPGTILECFHDGNFIVQTRDYGYLVTSHNSPTSVTLKAGDILT